mmetsp:Transcript_26955/g.26030  ORF Transcript_26955/g.26030 Transcript_26955/m.26030 type:complete len:110 (-) Transcript_26955:58-387(-)
MIIVQENGRIDFIEYAYKYHSSTANYNYAQSGDPSYVAVVDYNNINLTPLGKLMMPPPMFEKQFKIAQEYSLNPLCISMFGDVVSVVTSTHLVLFSCKDTTKFICSLLP